MAGEFWLNNAGELVMGTSGEIITCDNCPCAGCLDESYGDGQKVYFWNETDVTYIDESLINHSSGNYMSRSFGRVEYYYLVAYHLHRIVTEWNGDTKANILWNCSETDVTIDLADFTAFTGSFVIAPNTGFICHYPGNIGFYTKLTGSISFDPALVFLSQTGFLIGTLTADMNTAVWDTTPDPLIGYNKCVFHMRPPNIVPGSSALCPMRFVYDGYLAYRNGQQCDRATCLKYCDLAVDYSLIYLYVKQYDQWDSFVGWQLMTSQTGSVFVGFVFDGVKNVPVCNNGVYYFKSVFAGEWYGIATGNPYGSDGTNNCANGYLYDACSLANAQGYQDAFGTHSNVAPSTGFTLTSDSATNSPCYVDYECSSGGLVVIGTIL